MLTPILGELRAAGIPFHNPYRPTAAEWNPLLADKPHKPVHRLLNFFRAESDFWGDAARTPTNEELWNAMQYLGKSAFRLGAKGVLESLAKDRFRQKDTVDVDELIAPGLLTGSIAERAERYAALQWDKLQDETFYLARLIRKYGPGVLSERPQTIVGTIHSVKGGEAEIVYLFPELSPSALRAWYVDGEERDAIIRTYYVGLTRARESVFLCELHKDGVDWLEHHARVAVAG